MVDLHSHLAFLLWYNKHLDLSLSLDVCIWDQISRIQCWISESVFQSHLTLLPLMLEIAKHILCASSMLIQFCLEVKFDSLRIEAILIEKEAPQSSGTMIFSEEAFFCTSRKFQVEKLSFPSGVKE